MMPSNCSFHIGRLFLFLAVVSIACAFLNFLCAVFNFLEEKLLVSSTITLSWNSGTSMKVIVQEFIASKYMGKAALMPTLVVVFPTTQRLNRCDSY
jgi:hypothetical protein